MKFRQITRVVWLLLFLSACSPSRINLPESEINLVEVPGGSTARMWGDELPGNIGERIEVLRRQFGGRDGNDIFLEPPTYLALSGGGARGAFGVGVLKGWSESGTRPELFIVSGISAGALIAPFAFLGSEYDQRAEDLYTGLSTEDLIQKRSVFRGVLSDALYDTNQIRVLLQEFVDDEMIARIAAEYERGRRLLIGTTNLEARRSVIWNIGAIAQVGTAEAYQLIRDVMLASASIPGVFPPVKIRVWAGDKVYDELHVDGGVSNQVFLYPAEIDFKKGAKALGVSEDQTVYIIRNGYLNARWSEVDLTLPSILTASLDTMIRTQGIGDLYRIYLGTIRDEAEFKLAYIPPEFSYPSSELFDPEYMRALFEFGYERAKNGYPWESSPPGFDNHN